MQKFDDLIEPDLFHWERLLTHMEELNLNKSSAFFQHLQQLALGSNYAISQLNKHPELILALQDYESYELNEQKLVLALENISDIDEIKKQLRLFRHEKMVEIIYLDICRDEKVETTLFNLSELAEFLIQQALAKSEQILSAKHGIPIDTLGNPMQLNIIGMGKLGGRELNFSSDIDLICTYSDDGQLNGFGKLSHTQYFNHVTKLFKQLLHDTTADGFVYRVDLRLRPWGDSGPIVLSHNAFEHYYQLHGREWEQYAMVKARILTGSDSDKKYLQSILKPFIYRRYHDYRVFDGLAELKRKIDQQARQKGARNNIKIGHGGIREIEFFVQAYQILKGGRNYHLQTPSLFQALEVLSTQDITDQQNLAKMRDSYCFLRMLENRIQMFNDQQTHELPEKQNLQDRLSLLLGYQKWSELAEEIASHQSAVNHVFTRQFIPQHDQAEQTEIPVNMDELDEKQHLAKINELGFVDADEIHQRLLEFYHSKALLFMSDKAKKRFNAFFPTLLKQVGKYDNRGILLDKMLALLSSIAGRSVYFELLYQNIPMLIKLVHLFDRSSWIAKEVTRYPVLLESLLYPGKLDDRFNKEKLKQELKVQLQNVHEDIELELDVLRQFKRAQTIVVATAEIAREIDTDQVSNYLSELAEIILHAVYTLALGELVRQYGQPQCDIDGKMITPVLGIIAYGKLGGRELHYQSDLDIIFLHNSSGKGQFTAGDKSIDNNTFFSRLAQKIISKITLLTIAGKLYEIDTRLRPNGASGMLVSSLDAYHQYQLEKAWLWEHQAIIRARFIAGENAIAAGFELIRREIISLSRAPESLKKEIQEMREKMYQAQNPPEGDTINIKHSRGCMVDIEFLVQYWVLKNANKFASLSETTDNIGLITELRRLELISQADLQLRDTYQTLHKWLHAQVLQDQPEDIASTKLRSEIDLVKSCWGNTFTET